MSRVLRPFYIMAKPVCGVCNLDCAYCYYTSKPRTLYPNVKQFMMSEEILERYTREYLEAMPVQANFGWQGGEPLLAGKAFYRKAVEFQKAFGRDGQQVANAMQTNGTLLDEEWAEFFAQYDFLVGISLDGPPEWHDHFRRDRQGNPTFHRAWAGLELLRDRGVEFNVLVTLNARNAPHAGDIYRYFVNRGVRWLQFIPILEKVHAKNLKIRLKVICDIFPKSQTLPIDKVIWRESTEVRELKTMDMGLMPLTDDEWSRGKCGLKVLQYFAVGIPTVATPVGVNRDLVMDGENGFWARNEREWIDRILLLASDPSLRKKMGKRARETVERDYSVDACYPAFKKVLTT